MNALQDYPGPAMCGKRRASSSPLGYCAKARSAAGGKSSSCPTALLQRQDAGTDGANQMLMILQEREGSRAGTGRRRLGTPPMP